MKIEKISENQIRCTLSRSDLKDRELKLSELAYGSEKANDLFRDMMEQAFEEFGFEANDIPLIIEAIPVAGEGIVLLITKVEDPDELDTRFSRFTPLTADDLENEQDDEVSVSDSSEGETPSAQEDLVNFLRALGINVSVNQLSSDTPKNTTKRPAPKNLKEPQMFSFHSLDEVSSAAGMVDSIFTGHSTLYKNRTTRKYYLILSSDSDQFSKVINILSEFGQKEKATNSTIAYLEEHHEVLIKENAISIMASLQ